MSDDAPALAAVAEVEAKAPWERQKAEPAEQYDAFLYYLKLAPPRSWAQVRREFPAANWRWWQGWRWEERADAFDTSLAQRTLQNITELRAKMALRQAEVGQEMLALAKARLAQFAENGGRISAMDAARIAEIGAKLERAALGEDARATKEVSRSLETFALQVNVNTEPTKVSD